MTQRSLLAALLALALCGPTACGADDANPRSQCSPTRRLFVDGRVGPTGLDVSRNDPFTGGQAGPTFVTLMLEEGEAAHLLGLTSNTELDVPTLWDALSARFHSGAQDAELLAVATRPSDVPCDPRQGAICAAFGVDSNGDGILFGANEVIYPVESGELRLTEMSGNAFEGDFEITFGPLTSGEEEGGERGGTVAGCFRLFRESDRQTLY